MKINFLHKKSGAFIITACLLAALGFSGCSSGSKKSSPFQIAFCALQLNDRAVSEYGASLLNDMPELKIEGKSPLFTAMIMGEAENNIESGSLVDPMMLMGGIMKLSALISSSELDLVISNMENASRIAGGGTFMSLDSIFLENELNVMGEKLLSFDIVTTDGYGATQITGRTPVCGISITNNEKMRQIFGSQEIGVFIVANSKNIELAKAVMLSLI